MGLVDEYLSDFKVGRNEQIAACMAFFYFRFCRFYMGANDTGS